MKLGTVSKIKIKDIVSRIDSIPTKFLAYIKKWHFPSTQHRYS